MIVWGELQTRKKCKSHLEGKCSLELMHITQIKVKVPRGPVSMEFHSEKCRNIWELKIIKGNSCLYQTLKELQKGV